MDNENEAQEVNASYVRVQLYGDILEVVFSHARLIDLGATYCVSKSWRRSVVVSSLTHFNRPRPWLVTHSQSTRAKSSVTVCAYDPCSHIWIEMSQPFIQHMSTLQSSHSNLLYMLSPTRLSFMTDPLHLTWTHVSAPSTWHVDPIVGLVNNFVIVAGSTCELGEDSLPVEMYDLKTRTWETCEPMPISFKESAASTWLSTAVANDKLFVMEKSSGAAHWHGPKSQSWSQPFDLLPDRRTFHYILSSSSDRLILIGLIGTVENLEEVKIYQVNADENNLYCEVEIGEVPLEFMEKLKSETFGISSVSACSAGDLVYLYNATAAEEVVVGEVVAGGGGGAWRWWSVKNEAGRDQIMERTVFTCVEVGVEKLQRLTYGWHNSEIYGETR